MPQPSPFDAIPSEVLLALDNQLCFALQAAARGVQRAYQPLLAELDLTYPQYLVLLVLWEWDHENQLRPTVTRARSRRCCAGSNKKGCSAASAPAPTVASCSCASAAPVAHSRSGHARCPSR
jgi:hypothetical protein